MSGVDPDALGRHGQLLAAAGLGEVGASGVTPAMWNRPTPPDEAAAAPSAFSLSSPAKPSSPVTTPMAEPSVRPSHVPNTGQNTSEPRSAAERPEASTTTVARRFSARCSP